MRLRLLGDLWAIWPGRRKVSIDSESLGEADLSIANLETPISTDSVNPRPKAGPHIKGNSETLSNVCHPGERFCLALANNHMMDFGELGLKTTLDACQQNGVRCLGAGANIREAEAPIILEVDRKRIGILARCETQFGVAELDRPGVAAIDPTIYNQLRSLKAQSDIVVISVHGGAEMCPWPSPRRQVLLRSFVDAGADIVHGHHSHIPQGYEIYRGSLICYGLGNLLVDPDEWEKIPEALWSIVVHFDPVGKDFSIGNATIRADKETLSVAIENEIRSAQNIAYIERCNSPLTNVELLTGLWQETSIRMYESYYRQWLGFSDRTSFSRATKAKLKLLKQKLHRPQETPDDQAELRLLLWYHLFACESHQEAIATALGVLGKELEDKRNSDTSALVEKMMPWI